jgi:hypothetical protein
MLEAVRRWSLSLAVDKSEDLLAASIHQSFLFDNLLFGILKLSRPRGKFPVFASEFCSDLEKISSRKLFVSEAFFRLGKLSLRLFQTWKIFRFGNFFSLGKFLVSEIFLSQRLF